MILKTLGVCTLAAALAGGVAYFSTPQGSSSGNISLRGSSSQSVDITSSQGNESNITLRPTQGREAAKDGLVKYFKYQNGEFQEIPEPKTIVRHIEPKNPTVRARIAAVNAQAQQISDESMRDQAYMGLIDYASHEGLFSEAEQAIANIKQVEFRDTARSRIANAYAQKGHSDAAFALIDQVEVDELRDVIRLQAIEALIVPDTNSSSQ